MLSLARFYNEPPANGLAKLDVDFSHHDHQQGECDQCNRADTEKHADHEYGLFHAGIPYSTTGLYFYSNPPIFAIVDAN
jgi:hypothetical protein